MSLHHPLLSLLFYLFAAEVFLAAAVSGTAFAMMRVWSADRTSSQSD